MIKVFYSLLIAMFLYYFAGAIAIRYFIDELVFIGASEKETNESIRLISRAGETETLIRGYGVKNNKKCVIFFPGRTGGIPRYEIELFESVIGQGIPLYALSYPGYEGANGNSSFSNIIETTGSAVSLLATKQRCNIKKSVFVGRSLGASIALETAVQYSPKALVLDSVGISLDSVIKYQLSKTRILYPLSFLPIKDLLLFNQDLTSSINKAQASKVYIYQGELDEMAPYHTIIKALKGLPNIKIVEVPHATHKNAFKVAGNQYLNTIVYLINNDS